MTKQLYRVERERVVTDWWYVEANDEKNYSFVGYTWRLDNCTIERIK